MPKQPNWIVDYVDAKTGKLLYSLPCFEPLPHLPQGMYGVGRPLSSSKKVN